MRTSAGYFFMDYEKPSLTWPEHLVTLKQQGLVVSPSDYHYLPLISFHRLSSYFGVFYQSNQTKFDIGTTFTKVWQLYEFDRELRLLVSDAVERIEVAFRTALSETMSSQYGSHWFMQPHLFKNHIVYQRFIEKARQACQDNHDEELKHYYSRYDSPAFPPSWILVEKLSFGTCSNLFRNLQSVKDRKQISQVWGYHPTLIASWIDALRYTLDSVVFEV